MSLLFEDLFKRLNSDLKRMADSVLSKVTGRKSRISGHRSRVYPYMQIQDGS